MRNLSRCQKIYLELNQDFIENESTCLCSLFALIFEFYYFFTVSEPTPLWMEIKASSVPAPGLEQVLNMLTMVNTE